MMLFLFTPISCWWVTVATYIEQNTGQLGIGTFSPGFVGMAYSTGAIGAIISPLIWGVIADRWFSAEKVMAGLQLVCGIILWNMAGATNQAVWWWAMLAYAFCFSPLMGLCNSVCFRHLANPERSYPPIRALGTLSWVMGGWLIGYLARWWFGESIEATVKPLQIGAVFHMIAAATCLIVPATPPLRKDDDRHVKKAPVRRKISWDTVRTLFRSEIWLPVTCISLLAIAVQFYGNFANMFLNDQGVSGAAGHLAWGQVTEMVILLFIPLVIRTLGMKGTLIIGSFAWVARYLLLSTASDGHLWLYWPAILLHGLCYTFCFVAIQMLAERVTSPQSRGAVQGLISVLTMGFGALVGAQLVVFCQIRFLPPSGDYDWHGVWLTAAALAVAPAMLLLLMKSPQRISA